MLGSSLERTPAYTQDFDYLAFAGEEASRWLAKLRSVEVARLLDAIGDALDQLRRRNVGEGFGILERLEPAVPAAAEGVPSMACLLARHLYSARAYAHYLVGDVAAADEDLARAHGAMLTLVATHDFLIPVSYHFIDFIIQRARIARRENRWGDVKEHLALIRRVYSDQAPFCTIASGREIRMSDIRSFYRGLELTDEQRRRLTGEVDVDRRMELLEEVIYAMPDLVIPYP